MSVLRGMGCRFALDDFGSGLSSYAYLKNLPVDYLKIDGAFIRNLEQNPIERAMVSAINHIGQLMGLQTIAECVDTQSTLKAVAAMGIDYAQGHNIAAVEPLSDISDIQSTPQLKQA
jgi:Amt family ammonium transporter